MKSIATLIKLQKTYVDEQRLMLARAQQHLDYIEKLILMLEKQKNDEKEAARKDPANAVTYGAYLKAATNRGRELARDREIAMAAVEAARARLAELFEEQKRYEIAEEARIAAEAKEELKRETIELDEIGGMSHSRNKRGE